MKENEQNNWKLPAFGELCPSPIDWARMAAFIDGEGSILINPRRSRIGSGGNQYSTLASTFYLKLTVANTDVRLMAWLKSVFGGTFKDANTPKYYEGKNFKVAYHWSASANRAAWILYNCAPYFIMKMEQASIGMRLQETMKLFTRGPGKSLPIELVEERRGLKHRLLLLKARGRTIEDSQADRIKEVS